MANFIFGDCTNITVQHTLGNFRYSPKANETFTIDRGGIRGNDDESQITANGQMMSQLNRIRWSVEGPIAVSISQTNEAETLNSMAGHFELGVWTFEMITGEVFKGLGRPVGSINSDSNTGMMTLKVAGSARLEKL